MEDEELREQDAKCLQDARMALEVCGRVLGPDCGTEVKRVLDDIDRPARVMVVGSDGTRKARRLLLASLSGLGSGDFSEDNAENQWFRFHQANYRMPSRDGCWAYLYVRHAPLVEREVIDGASFSKKEAEKGHWRIMGRSDAVILVVHADDIWDQASWPVIAEYSAMLRGRLMVAMVFEAALTKKEVEDKLQLLTGKVISCVKGEVLTVALRKESGRMEGLDELEQKLEGVVKRSPERNRRRNDVYLACRELIRESMRTLREQEIRIDRDKNFLEDIDREVCKMQQKCYASAQAGSRQLGELGLRAFSESGKYMRKAMGLVFSPLAYYRLDSLPRKYVRNLAQKYERRFGEWAELECRELGVGLIQHWESSRVRVRESLNFELAEFPDEEYRTEFGKHAARLRSEAGRFWMQFGVGEFVTRELKDVESKFWPQMMGILGLMVLGGVFGWAGWSGMGVISLVFALGWILVASIWLGSMRRLILSRIGEKFANVQVLMAAKFQMPVALLRLQMMSWYWRQFLPAVDFYNISVQECEPMRKDLDAVERRVELRLRS